MRDSHPAPRGGVPRVSGVSGVSGVPAVSGVSDAGLRPWLGLFDSTMLVAGSMIGTGVFIVPAEMAREVGSAGWLLASWLITALLTIAAALSYGELAAMLPRAGGQYIYLREAWSPLWGFLYGWTLFLVIQTGTVAAVAVGFGRYCGVLWPRISENYYLIPPINLSTRYAISLSTAQLAAISLIALLTFSNSCGIAYGKIVQNVFTATKIGSLLGVIGAGLLAGWSAQAVRANFTDWWTPRGYTPIAPGLSQQTAAGLFIALAVAQVSSLFAADAWNNITFTAGEVRAPKRNLPLSLAIGTMLVTAIFTGANVAYVVVLPLNQVQHAPSDRVAAAMLSAIFPATGAALIALAIAISSFGCINGMLMSGARAYFAMARDGLFFRRAGDLNKARVPGVSLAMQGVWAAVLVLLRTHNPATKTYGNLYSNLLDYVMSAALLFYLLTIAAVFRLRRLRPHAERPYRAFGYPVVPALYMLGAATILIIVFVYRPATTIPGMVIVLLGVPVYFALRASITSK